MRERETKQTREEEKNKEKPREKSRGVVAEALLDLLYLQLSLLAVLVL